MESYVGEEEYIVFNISCNEKPSVHVETSIKVTVAVFYDNMEGDVSQWSVANTGTGSG